MALLTEQRWTELMASWLDEISGWDATWGVNGHAVVVGSDLAEDDLLLPGAPTSGSAILGIQSAVDHLNVLGDALRASGLRRPFGYYTLARAAIFASARTIWILSPQERPCRQERGLWMEWLSDRAFTKTLVQFQAQSDLTWDGRIADQFTWSDPSDTRDPKDLLLADGVRVVDGKADPTQFLRSDSLVSLVGDSSGDIPRDSDSTIG